MGKGVGLSAADKDSPSPSRDSAAAGLGGRLAYQEALFEELAEGTGHFRWPRCRRTAAGFRSN